eukprot:GGOE01000943.1.p1 GENE.GGOE01000943.1~~GGOE01000943.1.p1  ORF type:complete len:478 (-),score=41.58 GGOE01000943.1:163-1596(-)
MGPQLCGHLPMWVDATHQVRPAKPLPPACVCGGRLLALTPRTGRGSGHAAEGMSDVPLASMSLWILAVLVAVAVRWLRTLKDVFCLAGDVKQAVVDETRGQGIVWFSKPEAVDRALQTLQNYPLHGQSLWLDRGQLGPQEPEGGRGRTAVDTSSPVPSTTWRQEDRRHIAGDVQYRRVDDSGGHAFQLAATSVVRKSMAPPSPNQQQWQHGTAARMGGRMEAHAGPLCTFSKSPALWGGWLPAIQRPPRSPTTPAAFSSKGGAAQSCTVEVANVPSSATWLTLKEHFRVVGDVRFCHLLRPQESTSTCRAIVHFATEKAAWEALKVMADHPLSGHLLVVRLRTGRQRLERPIHSSTGAEAEVEGWKGKCRQLCISNIPPISTGWLLREHFRNFGEVEYCTLCDAASNGPPRCEAIVRFAQPAAAWEAMQTQQRQPFQGHRLRLTWDRSAMHANEHSHRAVEASRNMNGQRLEALTPS